ncbi:hypothetical protein KPK_1293 [Klebsiella variicola]|uniref:Uncharacterized protein n=1 Tax=Klebsiella variicola (strain 342) TaxID=507522 RepID=B5XNN3_KLEV3|nr:hypothetical protein KPK_1293 [Klebsiella variicola]
MSFPGKDYGAHLLSNLRLQFPEFDHHAFDVDGPCTLASLFHKPEFQQASHPAQVSIQLHQFTHCFKIGTCSDRSIQTNGAQISGTRQTSLVSKLRNRSFFLVRYPNLYGLTAPPRRRIFWCNHATHDDQLLLGTNCALERGSVCVPRRAGFR